MVFSNPYYFLFLAGTLLLLALPVGVTGKKRLLAAASCLFYALWDYRYLGLLLLISLIDYVCAARIAASDSRRVRRAWLLTSIVSNLGVLGYFKYFNFFVDNLNGLLPHAHSIPHRDILLPAGISFYTFKTMSYVIDVHRRELGRVRTWMDYTTFITFFPELIAGPIVRASVLLPQLDRDIGLTRARFATGASAFLLGFTKKSIADHLAVMVDPVFDAPEVFDGATLAAAVLGYSLQIYCDFSGYSDMAIGSAKLIGYDLPENFDMPYASSSITEFWRRWHMTLSFWLRDYLYISLGGNRRGPFRTYVNLVLTMLLGGLWHGASWNFVLWGGLHGVALALHRLKGTRWRLPTMAATPLTFAFVSLCWIPFRAVGLDRTLAFLSGLATWRGGVRWISPTLFFLAALVVLGHAIGRSLFRTEGTRARRFDRALDALAASLDEGPLTGPYVRLGMGTWSGAALVFAWTLLAFLLAPVSNNPFIYFQF
ncbi:MAG: MBOAT family O-acyltransferase [Polyangiales bacterium]